MLPGMKAEPVTTPGGPWHYGYLLLAAVLGGSIGSPAVPVWISTACVLLVILLSVLRPQPAPVWTSALIVLLLAATVTGAIGSDRRFESATLSASAALMHAAAAALPIGLIELARRRRHHRQQGWNLARSLAREEQARTDAALMRERAAMAGEIHDNLGHRLTLVTVQLGQLTLDPALPPEARRIVEDARGTVAEAAADLGETVQLLKHGERSRAPADRPLHEIIQEAHDAGVRIEADLPDGFDRQLSAHARAALSRVLIEALTNAAKHAPDEQIYVNGHLSAGKATLQVRNARPRREAPDAAASSGHGLPSLRHRLAVLGGELETESGDQHVLRAHVPADARPQQDPEVANAVMRVSESRRAADEQARRLRKVAWMVPAMLAAGAVLVTVAAFLNLTINSVMAPEEFARIQVGMPADQAEALLPALEMPEAPRHELPVPPGASCRFYEESVSLFQREDVFRICFADGIVVSTDIIAAP